MKKTLLSLMVILLFWACNEDDFEYNPNKPDNYHTLTIAVKDLDSATIRAIDSMDVSNQMYFTHFNLSIEDNDGKVLFTDEYVPVKVNHFADYVQVEANLQQQFKLMDNQYMISKLVLIHQKGKELTPIYAVPKMESRLSSGIEDAYLVKKALIKNEKTYTMGQLKVLAVNDTATLAEFGY